MWAKNPRRNDAAVDRVVESIRRFGFGSPIVARSNGEVIVGHTRLKAAKKLGLEQVPVRYMDVSEADARALAIADNKLGELADWDYGLLADAVQRANQEDASVLAVLGFEQAEIAKLLAAETGEFLSEFMGGKSEDDAVRTPTPDGYITFTVKLLPDQDRKLQSALLAAKRRGARKNTDALLAICDAFMSSRGEEQNGHGPKRNRRHREPEAR